MNHNIFRFIDPIKRMVLKGLTAEEILWEMSMPNIGRRPQLLNKGVSDDVLDTLIRKYTFLCSDLETRFRAYHASQKDKGLTEDLESLTGLEFQMYLMKLLKEHGFADIRTTGATGDQGADLIGKFKGRSISHSSKAPRAFCWQSCSPRGCWGSEVLPGG